MHPEPSTMSFFLIPIADEYNKPKSYKQNGKVKRATRNLKFAVEDMGFL